MRIATWNVNSLKARLPRVLDWLEYAQPDVLCMQETKFADNQVPLLDFRERGYDLLHHGEGRWNGVAIASKCGIAEDRTGFGDLIDPYEGEARLVAGTCGGIRVVSVYVPNGRALATDTYERKLEWLDRLREWLEASHTRDEPLVVCGDFNVAPEDRDVYNPKAFQNSTHVSDPERKRFEALKEWGLVDAFRELYDDAGLYTWWDYRAGNFHKHLGMRIDHILVTESVRQRVRYGLIDRFARKGDKPSDHAPLFVDLGDA